MVTNERNDSLATVGITHIQWDQDHRDPELASG